MFWGDSEDGYPTKQLGYDPPYFEQKLRDFLDSRLRGNDATPLQVYQSTAQVLDSRLRGNDLPPPFLIYTLYIPDLSAGSGRTACIVCHKGVHQFWRTTATWCTHDCSKPFCYKVLTHLIPSPMHKFGYIFLPTMGTARIPPQVKLLVALTFDPAVNPDKIFPALNERFGERQDVFGPIPFSWTEYYASEMGSNLQKIYVTYKSLIAREQLSAIKIFSNHLEAQYAVNGNRKVNIDPGYIAKDKLVLASTKDFFHRLYLGEGIFGEVTLHYRKGRYRFFSWTYPDYRDKAFLSFLEKARASLVAA